MNKIGIDLLTFSIIPMIGNSNDLIKLKLTSKFFYKNILTHNFNLKCENCKRNRFTVSSKRKNCYIENCCANDFAHPVIKYFYKDKPFCSFSCSASYYLRKSNKHFMSFY